jgi:regulator of protease activity HflC (stomatin/prohibitin superfamily)
MIVQQVFLKRITPPQRLVAAIEEKLEADQQSQRMQFILSRERQEAERKEIEAKGIQKFQDIVSQGINERLLVWKGIEATHDLAKSPNSKVLIIGSPSTGLPLMLGNIMDQLEKEKVQQVKK